MAIYNTEFNPEKQLSSIILGDISPKTIEYIEQIRDVDGKDIERSHLIYIEDRNTLMIRYIEDSKECYKFIDASTLNGKLTIMNIATDPKTGIRSMAEPFNTILGGDISKLKGVYDFSNTITAITQYCCDNAVNLEEVITPNVKTVDKFTFTGCNNLYNVNLSAVTSIGSETFTSTKIYSMYVDSSVLKSIGNGLGRDNCVIGKYDNNKKITSFSFILPSVNELSSNDISSLKSYQILANNKLLSALYLPNLAAVEKTSFNGLQSLRILSVWNDTYKSVDSGDGKLLLVKGNDISTAVLLCPSSTKFANNTITAFSQEEGHASPFMYTSKLTSIDIYNDYFHDVDNFILVNSLSTNLYSIARVNKDAPYYINQMNNLSAIEQLAFYSGSKVLKSSIINNSIKRIGAQAFYFCRNESISIIMDGLTELNDKTFQSTSFKHMSFASLSTLYTGCFWQSSIETFNLPEVRIVNGSAFIYNTSKKPLYLPKATYIGNSAFSKANFSHIDIPLVKNLNSGAFNCCLYLSSLNLQNISALNHNKNNFYGCESLVSVYVDNDILKSNENGQLVKEVQSGNIVWLAPGLLEYTIEDDCALVDSVLGYGTDNKIKFTANNITAITGDKTFYGSMISSCSIANVLSIDSTNTFVQCQSLTIVDFTERTIDDIPHLNTYTSFYTNGSSVGSNLSILVPSSMYDRWIVADQWSSLASYIHSV